MASYRFHDPEAANLALNQLRAQFCTESGQAVGGEITTGFSLQNNTQNYFVLEADAPSGDYSILFYTSGGRVLGYCESPAKTAGAVVYQIAGTLDGIADNANLANLYAQEASGIASGIKAKTDNLPADPASNTQVNTRLATTGYTAPPTVADIASTVWNYLALSGRPIIGGTYTVLKQLQETLTKAGDTYTVASNTETQSIQANTKAGQIKAVTDTLSLSAIAAAVWQNSTRTLTDWAGIVTSIWANVTRTLTGAVTLPNPAPAGYGGSGGGGGTAPVSGDVQWAFELVAEAGGRYSQLAISTEHVRIRATAKSGLRTLDPTAYTVQFAFQATSSTSSLVWNNAAWDEDGLATLLVGPSGGDISLSAGAYNVFVRIANAPETTIRRAGSFIVE